MQSVNVALPDGRTYEVRVGSGVRHELADVLKAVVPKAKRAAIVTQQGVWDATGGVSTGLAETLSMVGNGEPHKTFATIGELCSAWAQAGLNRNDVVVAVGGGMVTDIGGFAASCFHRGIAVVYVSTTLLGMIDAAIGGKTGVNLPEGKNLVGAYWQPSAVLCDTDFLETMPAREYRSGLGEMAKYHFLELDKSLPPLDTVDLETRIARCINIKAKVVEADEREGGLRAILNYGHTLAHAVEIATDFSVMHGEAVAIGLIYVADLAHRLGRISAEQVQEHRRIVGGYDLAMTLPPGLDTDHLIELMGRDKKALSGLTFVLDGPNGVESVTGVDRSLLEASMAVVQP